MKKLLIITSLFLCVSCTFSNQKKAESTVKKYLKGVLNDPNSYESVKFSKLDTLYSSFVDDPRYITATAKKDSIEMEFNHWKTKNPDFEDDTELSDERTKYFIKMNKYFSDQEMVQLKIAADLSNTYKKQPKGWVLVNQYRAKNGFGALTLHMTKFELTNACDSIIATHDFN